MLWLLIELKHILLLELKFQQSYLARHLNVPLWNPYSPPFHSLLKNVKPIFTTSPPFSISLENKCRPTHSSPSSLPLDFVLTLRSSSLVQKWRSRLSLKTRSTLKPSHYLLFECEASINKVPLHFISELLDTRITIFFYFVCYSTLVLFWMRTMFCIQRWTIVALANTSTTFKHPSLLNHAKPSPPFYFFIFYYGFMLRF